MNKEYFTKHIAWTRFNDLQTSFRVHKCDSCCKFKLGIYTDIETPRGLDSIHICLDCITKEKIIYDLQQPSTEKKRWLSNLKRQTRVVIKSAFSHKKMLDSKVIYKNSSTLIVDFAGEDVLVNSESGYIINPKYRNIYYIDSCRKE